MVSASSSALALAAWLRARDDVALTTLLRQRTIREQSVRDWFDLAEALLEPSSIEGALEHLDRPTLATLAAAELLSDAEHRPSLSAVAARLGRPDVEARALIDALLALGLLDDAEESFRPWDAVAAVLGRWPDRGLPSTTGLLDEPAPAALEPVGEADRRQADRGAADRAFAAVTAVGELIGALEREPARSLQRGGIALPDWRRLLAATSASDDQELLSLLELAEGAGLVDRGPVELAPTDTGVAWRTLPRPERWAALATGWLAAIPSELRDHFRTRARARWGEGVVEYLGWLYPAGGAWMPERARTAARAAELLGIVGDSIPSTPGSLLLVDGPQAAADAVAELFPPDVRQVYIQHDLSVIAPGPLAADVDARLRSLADVEAVGLASTFRITAASITRALTTGATIDEVRALLAETSLTGVPQPLDYLLDETARRFGSLRVGVLDEEPQGTADIGAHSYVRADDPALIGQLVVDQALSAVVLRRSGDHRAVCRFDAETLYWSLVDARYPAVFEDADGVIRPVRRAPAARRQAPATSDPAAALVERLREVAVATGVESGQAWMARQLELAIRAKLAVSVTVRMPDGTEVPYVLEPAGLAGGRLRARDRRADIERTLPLSHIVDVSPV